MGLVFLLSFRIGLNVVDSNVIDVGYAGVIGADRIVDGDQLYGEGFSDDVERGDTYGPLNYLAYVPFEQALPWSGRWDDLPAAHGAAIAFDLLVVAGLLLLGVRLRPGREGRLLGLALAYAWAAFPYTAFALETNSNDSLVALACVAALLALTISPARTRLGAAARGIAVAAGAAAKFAPLALAPLFAVYPARGAQPGPVVFALVLVAAVLAAAVIPFVPGRRAARAVRQDDRLPGLAPVAVQHLGPGRRPRLAAHARQGGRRGRWRSGLAFFPRERGPRQMAALGAAVLIALQLAATHWFYLYVVWFLPFVLVACLGAYRMRRRAGGRGRAGARARGGLRVRRLLVPALASCCWPAGRRSSWVPPFSDDSVNDLYVYRTFAEPVLRRASFRTATSSSSTRRSRRPAIVLPGLLGTGRGHLPAGLRRLDAPAGGRRWWCSAARWRPGPGATVQRGRCWRRRRCRSLCGAMLRTHFDLAPMALMLLALLAGGGRQRPRLGLAVLGLAVMTKGFPLVAAPAGAGLAAAARGGRRVARSRRRWSMVAVIAAIGLGSPSLASADGFRDSFSYQVDRPVQVESTPAAFLYGLDGLGLGEAVGLGSHRSDGLVHPAADAVAAAAGGRDARRGRRCSRSRPPPGPTTRGRWCSPRSARWRRSPASGGCCPRSTSSGRSRSGCSRSPGGSTRSPWPWRCATVLTQSSSPVSTHELVDARAAARGDRVPARRRAARGRGARSRSATAARGGAAARCSSRGRRRPPRLARRSATGPRPRSRSARS